MNDNDLIFLSFAGKNYESLCGQGDDELPIKVLDNERSHSSPDIWLNTTVRIEHNILSKQQ